MKLEQPTQITEKVVSCTKCHHTRESHSRSTRMEINGSMSFLSLRAECSVKGCLCGSYVGLVWKR